MKSRDQLLLEQAYASILTNNTDQAFMKLLAEDHKLIDELIEEGFGDFLKKAGSVIKGGVQKAYSKIKETLTSGLASTLVKAILSALPKEELENLINIIAKGQVPKDKVDQVKELIVKQPGGEEASVKESFISTKEYLAATLFTEANILKALESTNGLLVEARSGRELQKFAKDVAAKINELYPKNKKAMSAAIPKFTDTVSKYLGLPPQSNVSSATSPTSAPESSSSNSASSSSSSSSNPSVMDKAKGAVNNAISNVENKIPTGKGVIAKVMGFVKAHPKISATAAAVLLGIVVTAFAGSAPVVVPALIAFTKSAGIAGTTSIVKQMISGEKVDLKQAGKTALIGGALGGVGSVLATGLGSIAGSVTGMFSGGGGSSPNSEIVSQHTQKGTGMSSGSTSGEQIEQQSDYKTTKHADGSEHMEIMSGLTGNSHYDKILSSKNYGFKMNAMSTALANDGYSSWADVLEGMRSGKIDEDAVLAIRDNITKSMPLGQAKGKDHWWVFDQMIQKASRKLGN